MICYLDRTFCNNPNCTCPRKFTEADRQAAERWWATFNQPGPPPIAFSNFCGAPEPEPEALECK